MEVVSELQRELVRAWFELDVNFCGTRSEVHPRRCALDDFGSCRQAIHVDAEMVMAHSGTNLFGRDRFLRHWGELIPFEAEPCLHRAFYRRAILRLDEIDAPRGSSRRGRGRCGRRCLGGGLRRFRSSAGACRDYERETEKT